MKYRPFVYFSRNYINPIDKLGLTCYNYNNESEHILSDKRGMNMKLLTMRM